MRLIAPAQARIAVLPPPVQVCVPVSLALVAHSTAGNRDLDRLAHLSVIACGGSWTACNKHVPEVFGLH